MKALSSVLSIGLLNFALKMVQRSPKSRGIARNRPESAMLIVVEGSTTPLPRSPQPGKVMKPLSSDLGDSVRFRRDPGDSCTPLARSRGILDRHICSRGTQVYVRGVPSSPRGG